MDPHQTTNFLHHDNSLFNTNQDDLTLHVQVRASELLYHESGHTRYSNSIPTSVCAHNITPLLPHLIQALLSGSQATHSPNHKIT